jgi:hypothetical protein
MKTTELAHAAIGGGYQPLCCSPWRDGQDSELQRGQTRANREAARNPEGSSISGQEHSMKAAALERGWSRTLALGRTARKPGRRGRDLARGARGCGMKTRPANPSCDSTENQTRAGGACGREHDRRRGCGRTECGGGAPQRRTEPSGALRKRKSEPPTVTRCGKSESGPDLAERNRATAGRFAGELKKKNGGAVVSGGARMRTAAHRMPLLRAARRQTLARVHRMGRASMPNKKMNADGNKNRPATVASRQPEIKAMNTKKNLRFGPNTNKIQTRNFSLRSKQGLHPIHGGLRPPSLFLIGTKIWHTSNLD